MAIIGVISRASFVQDERGTFFQNTDGPYLDGLARHFERMVLVTTILRKGYHAAYDNLPKYTYKFTAGNIQVAEVPFTRKKNPGVIRTAAGLIHGIPALWNGIKQCDLVAIFLPGMRSVIACLFCWWLRKPYWTYLGSDWAGMADITFRWPGWRKKLLFGVYTRFVVFCQRLVMREAAFCLVTGKSLLLKHKYSDNATYLTRPLVTLQARDIYHREDTCQNEQIRLLCVANFSPRKGQRYLIEALPLLKAGRIPVHLTLVGGGSEYTNLQVLVSRLGLQTSVRFAGYVPNGPELWAYYRDSDIFVLPTLGEGFPRVIFEAMSQGLPVICSNVSGISQQLVNGKHLILVPARNLQALAAAVAMLVRNPRIRQELIKQGLSTAQKIVEESAISQTANLIHQHIMSH